jgi:copper chaperone CopZ
VQLMLSSPEITCDHCIATIRRTVDGVAGAAWVSGDEAARTFVVEVDSGGVLDALAGALAAEGYPLGAVPSAPAHAAGQKTPDWRPSGYRVERTGAGANVNYDCYCGCDAGFALDRAQEDPAPESCCCGNQILVGRDAASRLPAALDPGARYRVVVDTVSMPWGQAMDVALAIPVDA